MMTLGNRLVSLMLAMMAVAMAALSSPAQDRPGSTPSGHATEDLLAGRLQWKISEPLVAPAERPEDPCYSMKDPTVVFHGGRWHLFCTIRSQKRSHQIICDAQKAHFFFTTLDGRMWREETRLEDFPGGWSEAKLAIQGDIFEASHTYKLKALDKYLTLVEAQDHRTTLRVVPDGARHGWRYYKAYLADRLDGEWKPLAATKEQAFASMANTRPLGKRWTDSISHGELLRAGVDQDLEVDPANLSSPWPC